MLSEFVEFCKEIAPVATVVASTATVAVIPIMRKLDEIKMKIVELGSDFKGHERLDDVRFKAYEQRLNEIANHGGKNDGSAHASAGIR